MITDKLKEALGRKTVGIICPGPSLEEMDTYIERFRNLDFCWVAINDYTTANVILSKISKKINILTAYPLELQEVTGDFLALKKPARTPIGNSLHEFLFALSFFGKRRVFLFGADGSPREGQLHYKEFNPAKHQVQALMKNTKEFNENFPLDSYGLDVLNCSPNSAYIPFKKISYTDLFSMLEAQP